MAKGRGGGKTPKRVTELLKKAVAEKSQSAVARESGLVLLTVQRYLKGLGEPTNESMQKLSKYFDVSVAWLRGEIIGEYDSEKLAFGRAKILSMLNDTEKSKLITELNEFWLYKLSNSLYSLDTKRLQHVKTMLEDLLKETTTETKEQIAERLKLAEVERKRRADLFEHDADLEVQGVKFSKP